MGDQSHIIIIYIDVIKIVFIYFVIIYFILFFQRKLTFFLYICMNDRICIIEVEIFFEHWPNYLYEYNI